MEQLSGYEIAQQSLEKRTRRRDRFTLWIALLIIAVFGIIVSNPEFDIVGGMVPLVLILGSLAYIDGVELYFSSSKHAPSQEIFEQEMAWLFGESWRDQSGTEEFWLAHRRIHRRRVRRWHFVIHLLAFLVIAGGLEYIQFNNNVSLQTRPLNAELCAQLPILFWLAAVIRHAIIAFPSQMRLARREQRIGKAIQAEIQRLQPATQSWKEKPKRDVHYRIGEDGELEEISEYLEDEKPKRDVL
jgi:hypothetical protein